MPTRTSTPLAGQSVLVTGAARRVGAAIARELHGAGANVVLHHHTSSGEAETLVHELSGVRAGSAQTLKADLLDVRALPTLAAAAVAAFGQLDILVNNASTFYPTPVGRTTPQQWEDLMGTNVRAPFFLAQALHPALRQRQGLIINLIDIHAMRPLKEYSVYSTAKAALAMLTRSLARELAPEVRVNGIAPGPILWPEETADAHLQEKILSQTLLKRQGSPQDIARTALFLAADAPFITGQIIAVDGGRSVSW
jgi:pteridine reductase